MADINAFKFDTLDQFLEIVPYLDSGDPIEIDGYVIEKLVVHRHDKYDIILSLMGDIRISIGVAVYKPYTFDDVQDDIRKDINRIANEMTKYGHIGILTNGRHTNK